MVLAAPPIRKLHVGGRSRRHVGFSLRKHPVSTSMHRGLSPVVYDFALANGDELVSYTLQKPRHAPVRYYTHANSLYSIEATTNAAGSVVERYSYNAYGVRTVKNSAGATLATSAVGQDRGFTSYKLDSETGFYFARSRMYSAKQGRFVSRDFSGNEKIMKANFLRRMAKDRSVIFGKEIESSGGYSDGFDLYEAYFIPNRLDPTGHSWLETALEGIKTAADHAFDLCKLTCGLKCKTCCGASAATAFAALSTAFAVSTIESGGVEGFFAYGIYLLGIQEIVEKELECVEKCKPCLSSCPKKPNNSAQS